MPPETWSVRREGIRVTSIVIDKAKEVSIERLLQTLAVQYVPALLCLRIRDPQRVLVYLPPEPPRLGTVKRQSHGSLYLKPDEGYGKAYRDEELEGRLFPIESLEVLCCVWILEQRHQVDQWHRATSLQDEKKESLP